MARFKQYDIPADSLPEVGEGAFNTLMPWQMYAGMSERDLEAIYTYLRSIEPVANEVTRFSPPSGEMTASSGN